MLYFSRWKLLAILVVVLVGIFFSSINFIPPNFLPNYLNSRVVLGLDLQGGSYLLAQVDKKKVRQKLLEDLSNGIRQNLFNKNRIAHRRTLVGSKLKVEIIKPEDVEKAYKLLQDLSNNWSIGNSSISSLIGGFSGKSGSLLLKGSSKNVYEIEISEESVKSSLMNMVSQTIEVIRRRLDGVGTTEPIIQRQGADRILIQVPGNENSKDLKQRIGSVARLTFHLVKTSSKSSIDNLVSSEILLPFHDNPERKILLDKDPVLSGDSISTASVGYPSGAPVVSISFDTRGATTFAQITEENRGRQLAIVLDGQVLSAPVIEAHIRDGRAQISGSFTSSSAANLALQLRAGALPVDISFLEERTVGASLGADSVRSGALACLVAFLMVVFVMFFVYPRFGFFAVFALIINLTMIVAVLSILGATLTLPGIAGIVLTIGMAVDANVIIFERIKEELRAGKTPFVAVDAGYRSTIPTILDANLTTLIAGGVLFWLGSGPIRGFAVTLIVGILCSVFSAFTVSRAALASWMMYKRPKELKL